MNCLLAVFIDTSVQDYLLCITFAYVAMWMHIERHVLRHAGMFTILHLLEQSYLLQQNKCIICYGLFMQLYNCK